MISSKTHKEVKQYRKVQSQKKYRDQSGLFCLEGIRLITDATLARIELKTVLITEECMKKNNEFVRKLKENCSCFNIISNEIAYYISDVLTPQGIFATAKKLDKPLYIDTIKKDNSYLVLCSVRDPGNMGTILRTANALGFSGAVLYDCCELYNPKTVRATMGGLFYLPLYFCNDLSCFLHSLASNGILTFASVVRQDAVPFAKVAGTGVLFIGSEANGLPQKVIDSCTYQVTIPMSGKAESLNAAVAAAICMYELRRAENKQQNGIEE